MSLITVANDQHDSSAWLLFMELGIPTLEPVRIVSNNEAIIWKGNEYLALGLGDIDIEVGKGEIPNIQIKIPNANYVIGRYLSDYHSYIRDNGVEGNEIKVTFSVVPYKLILEDSNCDSAFTVSTQYINSELNNRDAIITVGAYNIFNMVFPNLIIGSMCNWEFKYPTTCGYSGSATTCNRTLGRCRELGNSSRFGGHAGVLPLGVTIALA